MKAFRDPVHDIIYFDKDSEKLLLDLIDTEEFQRLRHISQLGVSSFTYPGATHTRFSHSLGVTYLMKRFIQKILELKDPLSIENKNELKENRMLALVAALLHDIGHGPFSHAIENVTGINHEDVSIAIISGKTEINRLLEAHKTGFSKEVSDVILRTHTSPIVVRLLTSQLDVDRIDYLLRDSKMTGAGYGTFDLEWLINVLRIGKYQGEIEVGLDLEKGLSIAEDFVMARYYMYKHVYFHRATRSVEVMIKKILERAKQLSVTHELTLNHHLSLILSESNALLSEETVQSYLQLTDHTIWHYINEWKSSNDKILSALCNSVLKRELYTSIATPDYQMDLFRKASKIAAAENMDDSEIIVLDDPSTSYYKDDYLTQASGTRETDQEMEASERIVLFGADGEGFELSTKSSIIKIIRNESFKVSRIYFDKKYQETFQGG